MKRIQFYIFCWVLLWGMTVPIPIHTFGQSDSYNIFADDAPLKVSLAFDIKTVVKKKFKEDYHNAEFTYTLEDGTSRTETIRIRARGEFRKRHCRFPPLTLNFKKVEKENRFFSHFNKLKLVTHCQKSITYQQYVLKEYLIYKLFNALTDYSFRVRLVEITYLDSGGKYEPLIQYGFIIESIKELAERSDAVEFEVENIHPTLAEAYHMNLVDIFNYMVGNTDFSVPHLHNLKLLKSNDFRREAPIPVPYDFDYSGMVNAHYAIPDPILGIKSVRERKFWGFCQDKEVFESNYLLYQRSREKLYAVINDFKLLGTREQKSMILYLDSFYKIIDNKSSRNRFIFQDCRSK